MARVRKGKINYFEKEFRESAKALGLHYRKNAVGTTQRRGKVILTTEPGYDAYIVKPGGLHIAMELKSKEVHGSFPFANIQEHQFEGLQEMVSLGCPSYLIFNMRRKLKKGKLISENKAWAIEFRNWTDLLLALPPWRGQPRQSIPAEVFEEPTLFIPIPRIKVIPKGKVDPILVWDIRVIL